MSSNTSPKTESPKHRKSNFITIGSIIILILSAIAFVFLPGMFSKSQKEPEPLGYFRKEPIKANDEVFLQLLEEQINQDKQQGIDDNDPGNYLSALYQAFSSTIVFKSFSYEVEKSGYIVPESAVSRFIISSITERKGSYSPKDYNQLSNSDKLELRKSALRALTYSQYSNDFERYPEGNQRL